MGKRKNDTIIISMILLLFVAAGFVVVQLEKAKKSIPEPKPQSIEYLIKRNLRTVCLEGVTYWVKYPFGNYGFLAAKYDTITGEIERCEN